MPGLPQQNAQFRDASSSSSSGLLCSSSGVVSTKGIWSKHRNEITFDQLQKFWNELPPHARKELLRVDKQTLFEQARKNLYCSRCNGLLLEGFSHIVMYGKSLQQEGGTSLHITSSRPGPSKDLSDSRVNAKHLNCQDDVQDPSVHPWGGLAATRDGILTLLDCFLDAQSLKALQDVFDSARMRERERKLLYPDACGGGGRGWISQGMVSYGRGHGTREACALHTARLPCDTLIGFWSALGDETQQSLLRMKEEDFIERLMYRFESKRFCRDCRRNVIREFKELKELKRIRRETRCTIWFCVADLAFEYEVSDTMVQADWHQSFADTVKMYHHFEWAVGTGEGKSDIMDFKDVGMNGSVHVNGLNLGGLNACFITLRAWKLDGRCTELSVKAHGLKGQPCVHRRLLVGDGYVTITKGDCISRFFEQAEEAEEEEDDDSMDKDANDVDGEGSRLQKHAKSPELARDFLLDAATVIFKEQVEKAFREGTARQNAHSIFVCLALKLLEERLHVACKEIITLEKQIKLLEEEEKEKREDEERRERRKTKDREKKLRRKERLKGKEKERETKCLDSKQNSIVCEISETPSEVKEESCNSNNSEDSISESGDILPEKPLSSDTQVEKTSNGCIILEEDDLQDDSGEHSCNTADRKVSVKNVNGTLMVDQSKSSNWKLRFRNEHQLDPASKLCSRNRSIVDDESGDLGDESEPRSNGGYMDTPVRCSNGVNRQSRSNPLKSNSRICSPKYVEKFHSSNYRVRDRYEPKSCGCSPQSDYRTKDGVHSPPTTTAREMKTKFESSSDLSRPSYRRSKYNQGSYSPDSYRIPKSKLVWEPVESWRKYPRSNSDSDITASSSTFKADGCEEGRNAATGCQQADELAKSSSDHSSFEISESSSNISGSNDYQSREDNNGMESRSSSLGANNGCQNGLAARENNISDPSLGSTSNLDNWSSRLGEGDNNVVCADIENEDSLSTLDSKDSKQKSEGMEARKCDQNESHDCTSIGVDDKQKTSDGKFSPSKLTAGPPDQGNFRGDLPTRNPHNLDGTRITVHPSSQPHCLLPSLHTNGMPFPVFPAPSTMAYYHQRPSSWSATPANGLISFPQPNCYLVASPLGYGVPETPSSQFCMQYSAIQPFSNPLLDVGPLPTYQMVNKASGVISEEQTRSSKLGGVMEALPPDAVSCELPLEKPPSNCKEAPPNVDFSASGKDSKNFSLFHFGGPVAVSGGCNNINSVSRKEGTIGDAFSNSPIVPSRADFACSGKETTGEEYSLFAASNGTRFSFF